MKLADLIPAEARVEPRWREVEIRGLTADSRKVEPDFLFVALAGTRTDGARFAADAVARGAAAVMGEQRPEGLPGSVAFVAVPNGRRALARAAARFYPRQPAIIAAVTGTSGKTSVAAFLRQIWARQGHRAASIGTIGVVAPGRSVYGSLTTPDPVELHRTVDSLAGEGVTHLAIEASSHGLDQHRLDGLRVTVGAFTNLSRDHLDYHPTMAAYLAAKLRLFRDLVAPGGTAVVNADDSHSGAVIEAVRARGLKLFTVGQGPQTLAVADIRRDGFGQRFTLTYEGHRATVTLPLVGAFQVENATLAAAMAIASGVDAADAFAALAQLEGAKGRLERVGVRNGAPIFVDYAHKPDALAKTLEALRPFADRRLIVVFGAGGNRDPGKRPLMGKIAAELADVVVVTDDNPRSEDPAVIRAAILAQVPGATEIADRAQAIRHAVSGLQPGDVLVIAGKGHETGQIIGDQVLPFSDHAAVAAALKDLPS